MERQPWAVKGVAVLADLFSERTLLLCRLCPWPSFPENSASLFFLASGSLIADGSPTNKEGLWRIKGPHLLLKSQLAIL